MLELEVNIICSEEVVRIFRELWSIFKYHDKRYNLGSFDSNQEFLSIKELFNIKAKNFLEYFEKCHFSNEERSLSIFRNIKDVLETAVLISKTENTSLALNSHFKTIARIVFENFQSLYESEFNEEEALFNEDEQHPIHSCLLELHEHLDDLDIFDIHE